MGDVNLSSLIWSVADLLRGDYKQSEYGKVILPFTVLRRLDCVLESTKAAVLAGMAKREKTGRNAEPFLLRDSGQLFYNTSKLDLKKLMGDQDHIGENLRAYMQRFSPSVRDIFESFDFHTQIDRLAKCGLLYLVTEKFANFDLHPNVVSNAEMGAVFEELIRKFAELSNETAGEHFTPREVIRLMVNLLFIEDDQALTKPNVVREIYDPTAGTGGMLSVAGEHLASLNPKARLVMYGQELNPESYAICKADMLIKGQDIANIVFGNTLSADGMYGKRFDYMLSNPPFGVEWKKIEKEVRKEAEVQGFNGRFGPGLPRVSDGSLLFLLHLISKMRPAKDGGSRFGIVLNGSPLFTGGASSGESEIRRYVLENDLLEAIIGLPTDMFYNTGISTYIWIVSNRKPAARKGKVQLIDASGFWQKMRKSLGSKRKELGPEHIEEITRLFGRFREAFRNGAPISRIFKNEDFGYRTITVERPLRDAKDKVVLGTKGKGQPVPNAELRDTENVPLSEKVETYFKREVLPHAPDAWIDHEKTKVGYEIPFNRHFYVFKPPRPLSEIDAELKGVTDRIQNMIGGAFEMSFSRYPTYKGSGLDSLGKVPEHWEVKRLCQIGRLLKGSGGSKEDAVESGVACVRYGDLYTTHSFFIQHARTNISKERASAYTPIYQGDVLFAGSGETLEDIGKSAVNLMENIAYCGGDVILFRPTIPVVAKFLGYACDCKASAVQKAAMGRGTTVKHIYPDELRRLAVAFPPLAEQTNIVAFLDRETTKIDELVVEQQRLIELLKEKRQAVISHAVTRGLNLNVPMKPSSIEWIGDVPEHWQVGRLANLFHEVSEAGSDALPILSVSIHHGVSDEEIEEEIMERKVTRSEDRSKYKRVRPGDLVYNMMRAWQGGFGTVTVPGMVSPAYVVARPQKRLETAYIEHLLRTPQAIEQMRRQSRGVADFRLRLYWDEFKNIRVALPPQDEARVICAKIAEMEKDFGNMTTACEESIALLQERRTALISAAVTGQFDVRLKMEAPA